MSDSAISRVHYFERQFLRTQDFTDEQRYHVAMRRRHNIAQHIWGIVVGLELAVDPDGRMSVSPGMAIDGYGRELILPERVDISTAAFDERDSDVIGVWLIYDRIDSDEAPEGYAGCGPGGDGTGYRWREQARVRYDVVDPSRTDMRQPLSVPSGDLIPDPTRTPPDDPEDDWPVFLGEFRRARPGPGKPYEYRVFQGDASPPYAGLVGQWVVAPSGKGALQIGAERPDDQRRFAVFVGPASPAAPAASAMLPALEIDSVGATHLAGATTIHDKLTMEGGAIELNAAEAEIQTSGVSRPVPARPWHIYHQLVIAQPEAPADGSQAEQPRDTLAHELRIEMAGRGTGANKVVVGAWSPDDKQFKPCLTIADNCQVTVHGNLVVHGTLSEAQTRPAPRLAPQYKALALSASISAINTAIREQVFTAADAEAVLRSTDGRARVAQILLGQPSWLASFITTVVGDGVGRDALGRGILGRRDGRTVVAELLAENTEWLQNVAEELVTRVQGRDVLVNLLVSDEGARNALITRLVANTTWQDTIVQQLINSEIGRTQIVRTLLERDSGRESLGAFLVGSEGTVALQTVIVRLIGEEKSRENLVTRLIESGAGRQLLVAKLVGSNAGREALVSFLVDSGNGDSLRPVLGSLLGRPEGQQAFVEVLQQNNNALLFILRELVANVGARGSVIDSMLADPNAREAMIDAIWSRDESRDTLIAYLLRSPDRTRSLITRLIDQGPGSQVLREVLLTAGEGRELATQVLNDMLAQEEGRRLVITSIQERQDWVNSLVMLALNNTSRTGPRALALALRDSTDRTNDFIASLNTPEFANLANRIRAALPPAEPRTPTP